MISVVRRTSRRTFDSTQGAPRWTPLVEQLVDWLEH